MVFSSIVFLFLFLPVVLGVYHLLFLPVTIGFGRRFWLHSCNLLLLLASLVFYFWGEQFLIWIIIVTVLIDYLCGLVMSGALKGPDVRQLEPGGPRSFWQKFALVVSIFSNLALLGFFKYFNFGIDSFNNLMEFLGAQSMQLKGLFRVTLPLGISFYIFQAMSYTIDVYRGHVRATRNLIDFACYVTMFPQLVAGPIVRYSDIAEQLVSRTVSKERFVSGISRFVVGLGKKVLVANTVSTVAEEIFTLPKGQLTTSVAWLGVVAYTIQIYFDFSGYSDMAIGLGRMFGFEYKENFNYPYISASVREFWRRWHISLSTWFRDYLYFPLGGSRGSEARTYFNLIIVFFLCGLWHGASRTFVIWGLYHGLFLVLERLFLGKFFEDKHRMIGHIYTLLVVMCGWVIFASDTFSGALGYLAAMFGLAAKAEPAAYDLSWYLSRDVRLAVLAGVIFSMPVLPALAEKWRELIDGCSDKPATFLRLSFSFFRMVILSVIMLLCAMFLSAGTHNPFIYFRF